MKQSWYQQWHRHPLHSHIHWGSFVVISLFLTFFIINAINNAYYPQYVIIQASKAYADVNTGLTAYYAFDEGSGVTAGDSAGSFVGTITGGATWATGQIGGALQFDGVDDRINAGPIFSSSPSAFTVTAWVKQNTMVSGASIAGKFSANQGFIMQSSIGAGTYRNRCTVNTTAVSSNAGMSAGQWYLMACTWDGSTLHTYLNGVDEGSVIAVTFTNPSGNFEIGKVAGNAATNGIIDDVRVYNRALSVSELSQLYTEGSGLTTPPPAPPPSTPTPTNGSCGSAAKTYASSDTFPSGAYCSSGTASPSSPSDPNQGN